jgi:hypothetical protein
MNNRLQDMVMDMLSEYIATITRMKSKTIGVRYCLDDQAQI